MRRRWLAATAFSTAGAAALFRGCASARSVWTAAALPQIRAAAGAVFSRIRVPACEMGLIALLVLAAVLPWFRKGRSALMWLCALLALSLTLTWLPVCFEGNAQAEPDARTLAEMCRERATAAARARAGAAVSYDGDALCERAAALAGSHIPPKVARLTGLWRALGISGWYSPLTNEAVVDFTISRVSLPFTLLHELAHARGVSSEAEASFEAYLACRGGDAYFRYSGEMSALWQCMRALRRADESAWRSVVSEMDEAVLRDFRAMNGFGEAREGVLSRAQDGLTDWYLWFTGSAGYEGFVGCLAAAPS